MKAELYRQSRQRSELLMDASGADPTFAPARWHSGQALIDTNDEEQQWRPFEETEDLAAENSLLAEA